VNQYCLGAEVIVPNIFYVRTLRTLLVLLFNKLTVVAITACLTHPLTATTSTKWRPKHSTGPTLPELCPNVESTVYKVETIGDAYLVVSGLPTVYDRHAQEMSLLALELLDSVTQHVIPHLPEYQLQIRVGLHSGKSESITSYQLTKHHGGKCFPERGRTGKGWKEEH